MRREIEQHKRRLDDLLILIDSLRVDKRGKPKPNSILGDGSKLLLVMQDYLVVALNSFVEQSIRTILIDYVSDNLNDVDQREEKINELKKGTNYTFPKIIESVEDISSRIARKLKERMSGQSIKAITDVLEARHDVAHRGKPTSLTYRDIVCDKRNNGIYYYLIEAVRVIDGLFPE